MSKAGIEVRPGSVERSPKRVRAYSEGHLVVDSQGPLLVWEQPFYPYYALLGRRARGRGRGPEPRERSRLAHIRAQ